jgi:hypothetical protein
MRIGARLADGGNFVLSARALAFFLGAALIATITMFAGAQSAQAQPATGTGSLPVTGDLEDGGTFEGTVSDLSASVDRATGDLLVSGTLTGTATTAAGETQEVTQEFTTNATAQQGEACDVLFLDLGPIFLDLLGLTVDLSPVQLDVNAVPGPGNLLGNLLCAITGLLDGPGETVNAISNLLNRIFGLLG